MKRQQTGVGIGATSILVILMCLCLTVFGTLALVTARADRKLTQQTIASTEAYYRADALAQKQFALLDAAAKAGGPFQEILPEAIVNDDSVAYTVPVSDALLLAVVLEKDGTGLKISSYRLITTGEWAVSDGLNVYTLP